MKFSEKLYMLRTQYGYSQESLAEIIGVSRQAISKWELGSALPDTEKIILLSEAFDVSIDSLLKESYSFDDTDNIDRIVIKFLNSAQDMDSISKELLDIAKDGVIDEKEQLRMNDIIEMLDGISNIIHEVKQKIHC